MTLINTRRMVRALAIGTVVTGALALSQETSTDPAAVTSAPASNNQRFNNWTWKTIRLSGVADGYFSNNFDNPASGKNFLRNFDTEADSWDLNMLKFAIEKPAEPVGFRMDLGLGRGFDIFQASEPTRRVEQLNPVMQAYVSVKPAAWKGLQVDFGKFFTSAGAELTETHLNYNYSRALLYANGPYYHFGVRATAPVTKSFTAGVQLLNGWNNVIDNNRGKTVGLTGVYTKGKVVWGNTYYMGQEKFNQSGMRNFWDTVLTVNASSKQSLYVNFDYGQDKQVNGPTNRFLGVGVATRYALSNRVAFSPRVEWYNDAAGYITGTKQQLKEFTMTGEYKFFDGLLSRVEFRRDWSDQNFFDRRAGLPLGKSQTTFLVGFVGYFGPKQ